MSKEVSKITWTSVLVSITWLSVMVMSVVLAVELVGTGAAVATGLVMLCSFFLIRKTSAPFDLRRLTITSFWYATYLAMIFFPSFFVFADQELHPSRVTYLFAVESVLITVPLGALLVSKLMSFSAETTDQYFESNFYSRHANSFLEKRFLIFLGIALIFTCLYLKEVPTIPLFFIFHNLGDLKEAAALREDSFKLLVSHFEYAYFVTRGTLYPMLILVAFGCYLLKRSKKWLLLFWMTLALGVFFAALSLAKLPVALIFLVLALFTYFYRHRSISMRQTIAFFCLIFLFPVIVLLSIQAGTGIGAEKVAQEIGGRLLYGPSEVVYYYFEVFPDQVGYLHGRSIGKLSAILGEDYFNTPNFVGQYGYPQYIESVNANAAFIGDMNADFGMWGVLLGGVFAGALMQGIHIYLMRRPKTIANLACYALIVYEFWDLNSKSLPTVLASNGTLLALVIARLLEPTSDIRLRSLQDGDLVFMTNRADG